MHVIALENELSSRRGGQELNLLEICHGLFQRGHRISLVYIKEGDLLEKYQSFCSSLTKVNSYGFDRRKLKETLTFISGLNSIREIPIEQDTVVFSNDYYSSFFGCLLSSFRSLPFVCYLQLPPLEFNYQRRIALKRVNQFVAVSDQTKNDWLQEGIAKEKIDVVYNGTDLMKFRPVANSLALREEQDIAEDVKVIGYVGRIDKPKGLEVLIKASALLADRGVNIKLLIAGKPLIHFNPEIGDLCSESGEQYLQSLKQLAKDLGIEQRVSFLGHLTNTATLYQTSDVTVVPSLWSEPFGRVVIESMACGTPVVASQIGGIPEILTGEFQAQLFEPGNAQELAKVLQQNLDWKEKDPQLGQRCREHMASRFSLDSMVNGIEAVLLKTMNQQILPKQKIAV
ncbi:MAG: glycosyltransferase family 4 protein [Trichocoleus desertorum ATA4-8-CV12]|jgi:glycosyltransferase involved in cell wall biosynthesis|nr:glycosyltransferase family 4 protein [Trichocoleus desertorum ATA4-8-CV12]